MSAKALIDVTLATRGALRLAGAGVAARSIRSVKPMEGSDLVTHPVPPTMINQSHPVRTDQHHEPLVPRQSVIQPARRAADRQLPDQLPTSLNLAAERHELEAEFKPSREQSAKLEEPRRQQPLPTEYVTVQTSPPSTQEDMHSHGQKLAFTERPKPAKLLKASKVPSSRLGRMVHYGGLAAGLGFGAASEALRRVSFGSGSNGGAQTSLLMSESNVRRLVDKLSRMRGAALKLGQFMSIQDTRLLPRQIEEILTQVQNSANYMPEGQTERVLTENLGSDWRMHFDDFEMIPFAAASIGQVHAATLSGRSPLAALYPRKMSVAVKVQFPGVRDSIRSDLGNLKWLLAASAILPKGLYLDNTIRVLERELDEECDYEREADSGNKMRNFLQGSPAFDTPRVVQELCGPMVLTTEFMSGRPLTEAIDLDQPTRDNIGSNLLELCLKELFVFRTMQTDPNWSNFLYNDRTGKLELIDFGATREYSIDFINRFRALLQAAIVEDEQKAIFHSRELGYLTGDESQEMLNAHLASLFALATPFRSHSPNPFPFGELGPPITSTIRSQIPIMLKHRLSPPPSETYSLNRKLSGAFLLCERLRSRVRAQPILHHIIAPSS